jgi:hypothetical protein
VSYQRLCSSEVAHHSPAPRQVVTRIVIVNAGVDSTPQQPMAEACYTASVSTPTSARSMRRGHSSSSRHYAYFSDFSSLYLDMAVAPRSRSLSRSEASKTKLLLFGHAYDRVALWMGIIYTAENVTELSSRSRRGNRISQAANCSTKFTLMDCLNSCHPCLRPELPRAVEAGGLFRPDVEKNFGSDLPKRPNTFSTNRGPHTIAM